MTPPTGNYWKNTPENTLSTVRYDLKRGNTEKRSIFSQTITAPISSMNTEVLRVYVKNRYHLNSVTLEQFLSHVIYTVRHVNKNPVFTEWRLFFAMGIGMVYTKHLLHQFAIPFDLNQYFCYSRQDGKRDYAKKNYAFQFIILLYIHFCM